MRFGLDQFSIAAKSVGRNFRKNWQYASLNVLGLSIAFATLILIVAYLYQETTYENFYRDAHRIYRPTYHLTGQNDFEIHFARIPVNYINELPEEIPEIKKLIRFQNQEQKYLKIGENRFKPHHAYITDHDVFEVFDLPFLLGDPGSALASPQSIVLTESAAIKYFSTPDIIGEEIIVTGDWSAEEQLYKVTGVLKDLPTNTHLPIDILFSFANEEERSGWAYIYTLLEEGAEIKEVEAKMPAFIQKYAANENSPKVNFEFQPVTDIHLHSQLAREIRPNGQVFYVKLFFWVGVFIWIIALVNFTNLSMALALSKAKEVGVRKILGASGASLTLFSLTESVLFSLFALLLGAIFAVLLFPAFGGLTGISLLPPMTYLIPFLIIIALCSGILAGVLPAIVMRSVSILQIIKQGNNWSMKKSKKSINERRVMISIQFCVAIILISSAMLAQRQFTYINDKNLGLTPDQIIALPTVPYKVTEQYPVFKNRLKDLASITEVSACMQVPSSEIRDVGPVLVKGANDDAAQAPMMDMQIVDPDFIQMMGLEFLAGEDVFATMVLGEVPEFDEQWSTADYLSTTPRKYLINETAMKQLGWNDPAEAIGQDINWSIGNYKLAYGPIAGVIKDYHQETLKNKVDPLVLTTEPIWMQNILIKVQTKDIEATIAEIDQIWNDLFPYALEYHFLDEMFDKLYTQDRVQLKLLGALALIAIFIAFMGLVGLVAYALNTRSKELAIRRVIGANLWSLTTLIGKEYFVVLTVAALVGVPLSYYWISNWLNNFAYHIDIPAWIYLLAVLLVYSLLLLTIYLQTLKATVNNPVEALREE